MRSRVPEVYILDVGGLLLGLIDLGAADVETDYGLEPRTEDEAALAGSAADVHSQTRLKQKN